MLERLAAAVEFRDDATGDHTKRVGLMSARLAETMGFGLKETELIKRAAPLHDIGKVGIPDAILLKPGAFTAEERSIMQSHTTVGAAMLANGRSDLVRLSQKVARSHHERYDGSGYPDRLSREDIPLEARIVAVADFVDALTHDRAYRRAFSLSATLEIVIGESGKHFDPTVVSALLGIERELAGAESSIVDHP